MIILTMCTPVMALHMTTMSKDVQTSCTSPVERRVSLKLPLKQADFHWVFTNKKDFLAGKLIMRIIRGNNTEEIIIFEKNEYANGWSAIPFEQKPDGVYFGFQSDKKYLTAPNDKLEIELTVLKDLEGIGPTLSGVLPTGTYVSRGTYSGLIDEFDVSALKKEASEKGKDVTSLIEQIKNKFNYKAFTESWETQWSLNITSEKGWLQPEQAERLKKMMEILEAKDKKPE